jgi:hypothetical protein
MGSFLRFETDYYEKTGPDATDWTLYPPAAAQDWFRLMRPDDAGAAYAAAQRINFASYNNNCPGAANPGFGGTTFFAGLAAADRYFALPEYFPRAGSIRRICFFGQQATMLGSNRIQLHIYSDGVCSAAPFVGYHYPDQLLASGTLFSPSGSGVAIPPSLLHVYDSLLNLAVDAGTLLWFVWRSNASSQGGGDKLSLSRGNFVPWMGFTPGATDVLETVACGFHHTTTFVNGADQTFPQTAPLALTCGGSQTQTDMPAIGFGFERAV